jgi:hypothetical protein
MNPIILVADASPEIGWGHAMRTLAVAQVLEDRGVPMVWITNTQKEILLMKVPCPVGTEQVAKAIEGQAVLIDFPVEPAMTVALEEESCTRVLMVDEPRSGIGPRAITVAPHFGAEDWDFGTGAVCTGPRWMPLRKEVESEGSGFLATARTLAYRLPEGFSWKWDNPEVLNPGGSAGWWTKGWSLAVVPASTVAYECMALGIPVLLTGDISGIGQAMIDAGVASYWARGVDMTPEDLRVKARIGKQAVDGGGAERVANLLLSGGDWKP